MDGFHFRLENVRRYRQRAVEHRSRLVAQAERKVAVLSRRIGHLDEDIARKVGASEGTGDDVLRVEDLMVAAQWLGHLRSLREDLLTEMATAVKSLAAERDLLMEAWQELDVLTRLKKKQKLAWETDQLRQDRREMDEIGQIRSFRHGVTHRLPGRRQMVPLIRPLIEQPLSAAPVTGC